MTVLRYVPGWITPDRLSYLRIIALPVLFGTYSLFPLFATSVYVLGAVTDFLDGALARARGQFSAHGKRLDEVTDKLFVGGVLVLLFTADILPFSFTAWELWATVFLVVRDGVVTYLRSKDAVRARALPVLQLAKWKTGLLMCGLGLLLIGGTPSFLFVDLWGRILFGGAVLCALISGVQYVVLFRRCTPQTS